MPAVVNNDEPNVVNVYPTEVQVVAYPERTTVTVLDDGERVVVSTAAAQGPQGEKGATGTTGERGGVPYRFSTSTTDSDPGAGFFRFDSAIGTSVTQMFISNVDINGLAMTGWFDTWDDSTAPVKGYLTMRSRPAGGQGTYVFAVTGSVTAAVNYYKVPVTYVTSLNLLPINNANLGLDFSRAGDIGPAGPTGATGPQGATGAQGPQGDPGVVTATAPVAYDSGTQTVSLNVGTGLTTSANNLVPDFGSTSGKVTEGNDARLSDARTPTAHKSTHATGGSDALTPSDIGAAPSSGISPSAISGTAVVDNDPRLSDARTPTAHATSHESGGSDELELAPSQITGTAVIDSDSRLTDARTPTAHATSHESGGSDELELAPSQITGTAVVDSDSRLTDARTPTAHATSHESGGSDELELAPSQITGTAVVDSDSRLTDARTPTAHATSHESGGADELELAPSQITGTAVVDNDARLTDARTPTAHAASHESGGADELELAPSQITGTAVVDNDARLTDARTPTAHATSHESGGADELELAPGQITGTAVVDSDSRLTDARTPTAHASTHESGGSDAITLAQSQVTDLTTDLSNKAALASPTFTGTPAAPTASVDTNTTQIATTAFVIGQAGTATPLVEGSASAGTAVRFAREDHIHPADGGGGGTGGSLPDVFMLMGA